LIWSSDLPSFTIAAIFERRSSRRLALFHVGLLQHIAVADHVGVGVEPRHALCVGDPAVDPFLSGWMNGLSSERFVVMMSPVATTF
jgi:hypothetical protein